MKNIFAFLAISGLVTSVLPKPCLAEIYSCQSPTLLEAVERKIQDYANSLQVFNTIQKRQKELKFRNIGSFSKVNTQNFSQDEDLQTANALISIKINLKKKNEDILICRQDLAEKRTPFYFIAYPQDNHYVVHILNLSEADNNYMAHTLELDQEEAKHE